MIRVIHRISCFALAGGLAWLALGAFSPVRAQTSAAEMLLTWRAESYVPAAYAGKALPSPRAQIRAALAVVRNGKIINIDSENIYWYLNGTFLRGGKGMQMVQFLASSYPNDVTDLRGQIDDFQGTSASLLKTTEVRVVPPEVVIEPQRDGTAPAESAISVHAVPYFFGIEDSIQLSYEWLLDQKPLAAGGNEQNLMLSFPGNARARLTVVVTNPLTSRERASRTVLVGGEQ